MINHQTLLSLPSSTLRIQKVFKKPFTQPTTQIPVMAKYPLIFAIISAAAWIDSVASQIPTVCTDEEKEKHLCGICGKVVIDLKLHMTVKHTPEEEKNFECDLCPKKFSMEKLLRDHKKKAHALGKPWKCKVCGKDFKFEKYLKEHEIGHEEVKPFECHLCGMGFTRRHVLNRHLGNVHEGKNREDKIKKGEMVDE
ncbi:unnamed protein product [Orchesella dallaii]|uniref:C2H2-type domain-containing protein n=1 Tax=Orchesella dallaii TaxID=48710 RepID=A0ABP1RVG5_9HEXA